MSEETAAQYIGRTGVYAGNKKKFTVIRQHRGSNFWVRYEEGGTTILDMANTSIGNANLYTDKTKTPAK